MRLSREVDPYAPAESTEAVGPEALPEVTREVQIEAPPEEVWQALITEEGRERWLGEEGSDAAVEIDRLEPHHRLTWWWRAADGARTHVEFRIVAVPDGSRVLVTETLPRVPIATLAASFALVPA
jgi:uncharacterized protein YndB with AHSA1/START domain